MRGSLTGFLRRGLVPMSLAWRSTCRVHYSRYSWRYSPVRPSPSRGSTRRRRLSTHRSRVGPPPGLPEKYEVPLDSALGSSSDSITVPSLVGSAWNLTSNTHGFISHEHVVLRDAGVLDDGTGYSVILPDGSSSARGLNSLLMTVKRYASAPSTSVLRWRVVPSGRSNAISAPQIPFVELRVRRALNDRVTSGASLAGVDSRLLRLLSCASRCLPAARQSRHLRHSRKFGGRGPGARR